jgi:hypothetical protein
VGRRRAAWGERRGERGERGERDAVKEEEVQDPAKRIKERNRVAGILELWRALRLLTGTPIQTFSLLSSETRPMRSRIAMAAAASLLLLSHASAAAAAAADASCGWPAAAAFCQGSNQSHPFEQGTGYPDSGSVGTPVANVDSPSTCCCLCASTEGCNGWTLNGDKQNTCYLKTRAGPSTAVASKGSVSAVLPTRPPYAPPYPTPRNAKNVLFLAVDDMRPSLGAYNFTLPGMPSHSPHIDTFAKEGLLFKRAYVQYAYCSPSRNSFMSGRRPDTTKVGFGCTLPLPAMVEKNTPP